MLFSEIEVIRHVDDERMHTIKAGDYAYLYTGVKTKDEDGDSEEEDEKMKERAEWAKDTKNRNKIYEGEVVFNKYVFKFIDDGNIVFQSEPDYFYSIKKDYKFYTEGAGGNDDEEETRSTCCSYF